MRRATIPALVVVVGVLLLADFLIVNESLGGLADIVIDAAILVAAGAALAAVASLAIRRGRDLWRRRGDPIGAGLVLVGIVAMLVAGLRPGGAGARDPAVEWLLGALVVPVGATLFGLLFVTTLVAARRSLAFGGRDAAVLLGAALVALALLLPIGGAGGAWMSEAAAWALTGPIGAVFRGMLIGVAAVAAVFAARTLLGVGPADE